MLGDDADEDQVSRDVIGLSLGSPGKAFFYLENAKALCGLASDFIVKSLKNDYSALFEPSSKSCWKLSLPRSAMCVAMPYEDYLICSFCQLYRFL